MHNRFLAKGLIPSRDTTVGAIGVTWAAFLLVGGIPILVPVGYMALTDPAGFELYIQNPFNLAMLGLPPLLLFVLLMLNFVIGMVGLYGGLNLISEQPFRSVITGLEKVRWGRMATGALVWAGLLGVYTAIQAWMKPGFIVPSPDAGDVLIWLLPGLLLIPIQSGFEELAIRGQLMQAFGRIAPARPWLPLLYTSGIFAILHIFNAEVGAYGAGTMMLHYFTFGLLLGAFALMDEGLELSIGIHIGNNLFSLFMVSYPNSSIQTPSIWDQVEVSPTNDLYGFWLIAMVTFLIFFGRHPRKLRAIWVNEPAA